MRKTCWGLFTFLLVGSLLGCKTVDYSSRYPIYKEMESWVNRPVSELIDSWGPPDRIVPSDEGTIYTWSQDFASEVFNEKRFWVNESGIVFKWDILGPGTLGPGAGGYNP